METISLSHAVHPGPQDAADKRARTEPGSATVAPDGEVGTGQVHPAAVGLAHRRAMPYSVLCMCVCVRV